MQIDLQKKHNPIRFNLNPIRIRICKSPSDGSNLRHHQRTYNALSSKDVCGRTRQVSNLRYMFYHSDIATCPSVSTKHKTIKGLILSHIPDSRSAMKKMLMVQWRVEKIANLPGSSYYTGSLRDNRAIYIGEPMQFCSIYNHACIDIVAHKHPK